MSHIQMKERGQADTVYFQKPTSAYVCIPEQSVLQMLGRKQLQFSVSFPNLLIPP